MAHRISYNLSFPRTAPAPTTQSQPATSEAWSQVRQTVSNIPGEYVAGAVLTAVLSIWAGWLMWALSQAVENYRVF
jgi:hypothetical protein